VEWYSFAEGRCSLSAGTGTGTGTWTTSTSGMFTEVVVEPSFRSRVIFSATSIPMFSCASSAAHARTHTHAHAPRSHHVVSLNAVCVVLCCVELSCCLLCCRESRVMTMLKYAANLRCLTTANKHRVCAPSHISSYHSSCLEPSYNSYLPTVPTCASRGVRC
jgi:hypothetical protein